MEWIDYLLIAASIFFVIAGIYSRLQLRKLNDEYHRKPIDKAGG